MTLEELIDCNKICDGFKLPCEEFDEEKVKAIKEMLPKVREKILGIFVKEGYNERHFPLASKYMLYRGYRYNSDEDILRRMRSVDDASIYNNDLEGFCLDALIDAMQADYWYTYEKDYGHD